MIKKGIYPKTKRVKVTGIELIDKVNKLHEESRKDGEV